MANDSVFRRTPSSQRPTRQSGPRTLLEWDLDDDVDAESVLAKLDNAALSLDRRSGVRKAPSFDPYDNGSGKRRR